MTSKEYKPKQSDWIIGTVRRAFLDHQSTPDEPIRLWRYGKYDDDLNLDRISILGSVYGPLGDELHVVVSRVKYKIAFENDETSDAGWVVLRKVEEQPRIAHTKGSQKYQPARSPAELREWWLSGLKQRNIPLVSGKLKPEQPNNPPMFSEDDDFAER